MCARRFAEAQVAWRLPPSSRGKPELTASPRCLAGNSRAMRIGGLRRSFREDQGGPFRHITVPLSRWTSHRSIWLAGQSYGTVLAAQHLGCGSCFNTSIGHVRVDKVSSVSTSWSLSISRVLDLSPILPPITTRSSIHYGFYRLRRQSCSHIWFNRYSRMGRDKTAARRLSNAR